MTPSRLSPVTCAFLALGAVVGGAALLHLVLPSGWSSLIGETLLVWYGWTTAYCLAQFGAIAWLSRPQAVSRAHATRPAWDATWYLPVYVWGIESHLNVASVVAGDGLPVMTALPQYLMLLVTLASCLAAEGWARRRGCAARAARGSLPLPVVAAVLSVEMPWILFALPQLYKAW